MTNKTQEMMTRIKATLSEYERDLMAHRRIDDLPPARTRYHVTVPTEGGEYVTTVYATNEGDAELLARHEAYTFNYGNDFNKPCKVREARPTEQEGN